MKFIAISDLNEICFKDDSINIVTDTDRQISDEIYAMFFEQQSMGKQFKIKDFQGTTFEEILDEQSISETDELKQRIAKLEAIVEALLKDKQN